MGNLEYHGSSQWIVFAPGVLRTDRYGLDSATCIWKRKQELGSAGAPELDSRHPLWSYLYMEKRTLEITPGFVVVTGEYVGIAGDRTRSQFDSNGASSEEPIETHSNFESFAGTPASPLNGAIYLDPETQLVTNVNDNATFGGFKGFVGGSKNPKAGVTSFLSPQAQVRETWMATTPVSALIGTISTPAVHPQVPGNWLVSGVSFQQRGRVYQNSIEWRSSGRNLWDVDIYGSI